MLKTDQRFVKLLPQKLHDNYFSHHPVDTMKTMKTFCSTCIYCWVGPAVNCMQL